MPETTAVQFDYADEIVVPDAELLSKKEIEQERRAIAEERAKQGWLRDSPQHLAKRIPVSVFAMGDLIAG